MPIKDTYKLTIDISDQMKQELIDILDDQFNVKYFSKFTVGYGPHFYTPKNYLRLIPGYMDLSQVYTSFLGTNKYNNLVFYLPDSTANYFHFIRNVYFRTVKGEATFFIYCLYINLKNGYSIY